MVRLLQTALPSIVAIKTLFQSHNGAIAADDTVYEPYYVAIFQSHNGAIAAFFARKRQARLGTFQSHNGAIAAYQGTSEMETHPAISIPQWCDCCALEYECKKVLEDSFNPTMVRLLRDRAFRL